MTSTPTTQAATTQADVDPFTAAFSQFSLEDAPPAPKAEEPPAPKADEPAAPAEEGKADEPAEGAEGASDAPAGEEGKADEPAAPADDGGEKAPEPSADSGKAPSNDDLLERFAQIVAERAQGASKQPPAQSTSTEPKQTEQKQAPLFTQEEQAAVEEYLKDYGEVERGAALLRRAEYQQLTGYIFSEMTRVLGPFIQNAQAMMENYHHQQLSSSIEDYDDVRDKVIEWVGKQPAYLQAAYKHVIEQGTQDEIVDLVGRFRAETGTQAAPKSPAPAPKKQTELPAAAKKAASSLAPVSTKRSNASGSSVDPADFDSAFATFASKEL